MKVTGINKTIALAYIRHRHPIGTEVYDSTRSGSYRITKNSVFEVYSDRDQVAEFDERYEDYQFMVRNPGKNSPNYHIRYTPRRWVFDYFKKKINDC